MTCLLPAVSDVGVAGYHNATSIRISAATLSSSNIDYAQMFSKKCLTHFYPVPKFPNM